VEESLVDPDGDISVWDVLCDLLSCEGFEMPEGTTGENFEERMYKALMEKKKGAAAMAGNQPPVGPKNDLPPNPAPVVQEQPPLYMGMNLSLEQVQKIQDPQTRQFAQAALSLQMNVFNAAKKRRQDRIDAVCKRMGRGDAPKFQESIVKKAASAQLSMSAEGTVIDPMDETLDLIEAALNTRTPPELLTTPAAMLKEMSHPIEYAGEATDEKHASVAAEFLKNTGVREPVKV
jgi:hypothetical protein